MGTVFRCQTQFLIWLFLFIIIIAIVTIVWMGETIFFVASHYCFIEHFDNLLAFWTVCCISFFGERISCCFYLALAQSKFWNLWPSNRNACKLWPIAWNSNFAPGKGLAKCQNKTTETKINGNYDLARYRATAVLCVCVCVYVKTYSYAINLEMICFLQFCKASARMWVFRIRASIVVVMFAYRARKRQFTLSKRKLHDILIWNIQAHDSRQGKRRNK